MLLCCWAQFWVTQTNSCSDHTIYIALFIDHSTEVNLHFQYFIYIYIMYIYHIYIHIYEYKWTIYMIYIYILSIYLSVYLSSMIFACIYMDRLHGELVDLVWGSGILIVFSFGQLGKKNLKSLIVFLEQLNNFHPNLKFTHKHSREEINFLDVTVRVNHSEFIIDLYCKPKDIRQYLHFVSCHPGHTESSVIFSQALRMRRICC